MNDFQITDRDRAIIAHCSQFPSGQATISKHLALLGTPMAGLALRTRLETLVRAGLLVEQRTDIRGEGVQVVYMLGPNGVE